MSKIHPIFESILDDFDRCYAAGVDLNAFHIEHNGHRNFYTAHYCPKCEEIRPCTLNLCRLESTIECLPCAQRQLLEDTERFAKEARQFIQTALPTDDQTRMWWKALRSEIDGKLQGLAKSASEIAKRLDSGEK